MLVKALVFCCPSNSTWSLCGCPLYPTVCFNGSCRFSVKEMRKFLNFWISAISPKHTLLQHTGLQSWAFEGFSLTYDLCCLNKESSVPRAPALLSALVKIFHVHGVQDTSSFSGDLCNKMQGCTIVMLGIAHFPCYVWILLIPHSHAVFSHQDKQECEIPMLCIILNCRSGFGWLAFILFPLLIKTKEKSNTIIYT